MDYFYIIDRNTMGFYYIPYAGSEAIHGTLECSVHDLPNDIIISESKEECYKLICEHNFGKVTVETKMDIYGETLHEISIECKHYSPKEFNATVLDALNSRDEKNQFIDDDIIVIK